MSVDFSKVRVGDRVRLTEATTGDEVTFTVTERYGPNRIKAKANSFHTDDWDALEILAKPLPTKPGFYAIEAEGFNRPSRVYALIGGHWLRIPLFSGAHVGPADCRILEDNSARLTYLGGLPEKTEDNA